MPPVSRALRPSLICSRAWVASSPTTGMRASRSRTWRLEPWDEAVAGEVEGQVQGQAQLDDAEVAGEVGGADAEDADQLVAHLLGELAELVVGQPVQVRRGADVGEECGHGEGPLSRIHRGGAS